MLQYIFIAPVVRYGYTHNRKKKLRSISLPWAYQELMHTFFFIMTHYQNLHLNATI